MVFDTYILFTGLKMVVATYLLFAILMILIVVAAFVVTFILYLLIQTARATYKVIKRIRANSKP